VDLAPYVDQTKTRAEPASRVASEAEAQSPRLSIARRDAPDLAELAAAVGSDSNGVPAEPGAEGGRSADDGEASPLDVPTFLRRQEP
jgi:hypothetical protein